MDNTDNLNGNKKGDGRSLVPSSNSINAVVLWDGVLHGTGSQQKKGEAAFKMIEDAVHATSSESVMQEIKDKKPNRKDAWKILSGALNLANVSYYGARRGVYHAKPVIDEIFSYAREIHGIER